MRAGSMRRIAAVTGATLCVAALTAAPAHAAPLSAPPNAAPPNGVTLFAPNAVPKVEAVDEPSAVEVGVRFRPAVDGLVTGLRFYQGAGNTGPHVGNLWSSGGSSRAQVTFDETSTTGWRTARFTPPAQVTAGTTYIVSYFAPNGHYAADAHYFDKPLTTGPLSAPAIGNGVFRYGSTSGFPTSSFNATNYWVDPIFLPTGGAPSTFSFFTKADTPANPDWDDASDVELGLTFSSDVAGTVTALRFYKGPRNTGEHTGSLWNPDGSLLATATFSKESRSGWQTLTFSPPVAISAGTRYVASYHASVGFYSVNLEAFANFGPDSGPLHAAARASTYHAGAGFPDTATNHNYWVDVVFKPAPGASPSPSASAPTGSAPPSATAGGTGGGSGSLPVTGAAAGLLATGGLLLAAVGTVLFVAYRRRDAVKFVA
jgi:Domain of unknown function (DUF4082)